jgi:hypothetical protein
MRGIYEIFVKQPTGRCSHPHDRVVGHRVRNYRSKGVATAAAYRLAKRFRGNTYVVVVWADQWDRVLPYEKIERDALRTSP